MPQSVFENCRRRREETLIGPKSVGSPRDLSLRTSAPTIEAIFQTGSSSRRNGSWEFGIRISFGFRPPSAVAPCGTRHSELILHFLLAHAFRLLLRRTGHSTFGFSIHVSLASPSLIWPISNTLNRSGSSRI